MKRLPYRNTTYQIIRGAVFHHNQTMIKVHLKDSNADTTICRYVAKQFISQSHDHELFSIREMVEHLNNNGVILMEYSITIRQIGDDLYERYIYLKTVLTRSNFATKECYLSGDQYWSIDDIPVVEFPDPKIGIRLSGPEDEDWLDEPLQGGIYADPITQRDGLDWLM